MEPTPNALLRQARLRTPSRSVPGSPMGRAELVEAVNLRLWESSRIHSAFTVSTYAKYERGVVRWPGRAYRDALREVLGVQDDADLGFHPTPRGRSVPEPQRSPVLPGVAPQGDELEEIAERRRWLASASIDQAKLAFLGDMVRWIIDQDEKSPAHVLASHASDLRRYVHPLLKRAHKPSNGARLFTVAAQLSGAQAAIALDRGSVPVARAYAAEAFDLAEAVGDPEVISWARATQSLVEYYDDKIIDALAYAQDGLDRSPGGVHSVRLSVNGVARALARIGDADGVARAVDRAWGVVEDQPAAADPLTPSLTTGMYCRARTAGNAATAFLTLGDVARVEHYAGIALPMFDRTETPGPWAMTRLDLATGLLQPGSRDIDRAAGLVREAVEVADVPPFPAQQRAAQFLRAAQPWQALPEVREVRELVTDRSRNRTEGTDGVAGAGELRGTMGRVRPA
jgi:hypothetical protein